MKTNLTFINALHFLFRQLTKSRIYHFNNLTFHKVLLCFMLTTVFLNKGWGQNQFELQSKKSNNDIISFTCQFLNGQVQILTDTVCENAIIIETEHSLIDPLGAQVQCPSYDVHFYIKDFAVFGTTDWIYLNNYTLGSINQPASFVSTNTFDITSEVQALYASYGSFAQCNRSIEINYSLGPYWNPNGGGMPHPIDNLFTVAQINYKCNVLNPVLVTPSLPITTCGEEVTLSTNFSANSNYEHTWHHIAPNGPIIGNNTTVQVSDGGWYYVFVDNNNIACDSGRGQTFIVNNSFPTSISITGPQTINCSNNNFPILALNQPGNFNNHTYQWYYTNSNGYTSQVPFATNNSLIANFPGDFFLVTTNLSTGCSDLSNIISVYSTDEVQPFTLSFSGDSIICDGESLSNSLIISPKISQQKPPNPQWTFEVFNGNTSMGSSLNNISIDGNYWVTITSPNGCLYFTDTISINIDTLPVPKDSIAISIGQNPNNIYCQNGSNITITNFDYSSSANIDHLLYLNGVLIGNVFQNSPNVTIDINEIGWNHIFIISNYQDEICSDTLFEYKAYLVSEACCNDLEQYTLLSGPLDPGTSYNQSYLVIDDLTTAPGRFYDLSQGSFNFLGKAFKNPEAFGGESTGPNLLVANDAEIYAVGSSFNSFCDTMWGGILIKGGGKLAFDNSYLSNSYFGIKPDTNLLSTPGPSQNYFYNGSQNYFHNNYISVTYFSNSTNNASTGYLSGYLRGNFTCDPYSMQFPFNPSSNNNQLSYSYKAIDVYQGNSSSTKNMQKDFSDPIKMLSAGGIHSEIEDHVYGIYLNENAQFDTLGGILIKNPLVAGYFIKEKGNELITGYDSISIFTYQRSRTWQQLQEYESNSELQNRGYAIFVTDRPISIHNSSLNGDGLSSQVGYLNDHTVGITTNSNLILDLTRIRDLDYGTRIRANQLSIDLSDDIISENVYGLYLETDVQANLSMGCTQFVKFPNTNQTQYGIYVEAGASILNDIGGNNPLFGLPPAGNGWPVDPASPGSQQNPPTTFGSNGVDVYNWSWPENWFSIYDANAANENDQLGYEYFAYRNEFFGDAENPSGWSGDAVYPSILLNRTSIPTLTNTPCSNVPGIEYPLNRIAGLEKYEDNFIKVYPNPSENEFWISYKVGAENLIDLRIMDINGNVILSKLNVDISQSIDISLLSPGYYIVQIQDKKINLISESTILIK